MKKTRILDAITVFIVAVIILLFVSPQLTERLGIAGIAVAEILLAMTAIAAVIIRKDDISEKFSLSLPPIKSFFGAVVLALGANAWQNAVSGILVSLTGNTSNTDITFLESIFDKTSPFMVLIVVALVPAVCEELLFRGYLLSSFKSKKSPLPGIVVTMILFAGLHLDLYKLLPLLVMGWAYAYMTVKTGSVLPSAIFHFLNNALSIISFYTMKNSAEADAMLVDMNSKSYLGYGIAAIGVGLILVYFGTRILSGKPRKKGVTIATLVTAGVITTVGMILLMLNLMYTAYDGEYSATIREDTVYTESFTINEQVYASIDASIRSDLQVKGNIVIEDKDKNSIYEYTDLFDQLIVLEPGKYTVTYSFEVDKESTVAHNVTANVKVNCLSLSTAPVSNEDTEPEEKQEAETEELSGEAKGELI